jgi:hypothetical protein
MIKSFWQQTQQFRDEVKELIFDFNISSLYKKDAYNGDFQQITINGEFVTITIKQQRLYENRLSYKTNVIGDIIVNMSDNDGNKSEYEYNCFLSLLSWRFEDYSFRLFVPSTVISNTDILYFVSILQDHQNPIISTVFEQVVYYNSLDGAEPIVEKYKFVIENKKV